MRSSFHWPNLDGPPIETFRRLQLARLSVRHGGIEHQVVLAGAQLGGLAQVRGGLGESLSVHQVEAVVDIDIWLRGSNQLGTLEPGLRLLISGRL